MAGRTDALLVTYSSLGTEGAGIVLRSTYGFEVSTDNGTTWLAANATSSTASTVTLTLPDSVPAASVKQVV